MRTRIMKHIKNTNLRFLVILAKIIPPPATGTLNIATIKAINFTSGINMMAGNTTIAWAFGVKTTNENKIINSVKNNI